MNDEGSGFVEVPTTADDMMARWADRDVQYAKARIPMPPEQADAVRFMRMQEANQLPNIKERGRMFARAKGWVTPTHQEFGSLREWM